MVSKCRNGQRPIYDIFLPVSTTAPERWKTGESKNGFAEKGKAEAKNWLPAENKDGAKGETRTMLINNHLHNFKFMLYTVVYTYSALSCWYRGEALLKQGLSASSSDVSAFLNDLNTAPRTAVS